MPSFLPDPVVHELANLLDHVFGASRVLAERRGDRCALDDWYELHGRPRCVLHRPDIVIIGFDGPGTFTLIDVKTLDPSGTSLVMHHGTATTPLARHRELERETVATYFGDEPPPQGMRLVTFALSIFGAFGPQAQALLRRLTQRCGRSVPPSLSEESSWATPLFAPFARMSLSLACRRALAFSVRSSVVADPASVEPQAIPADPERSFQCACHPLGDMDSGVPQAVAQDLGQ